MKTKLEQFNRTLEKAIIQIISKHIEDGASISVSDVLTDPSFQKARVWVRASTAKIEWLNKNRHEVQKHFKEYLKLRSTPVLEFIQDDQYIDKIDDLFEKLEETK